MLRRGSPQRGTIFVGHWRGQEARPTERLRTMQLLAPGSTRNAIRPADVVASQSIDVRSSAFPGGGATVWQTDREYRLAGAREGIDTFASVDDALAAARLLSAGERPGLAVVASSGGYRVHDVRASSVTWVATSTHAPYPPSNRTMKRSSVPFAAGNLRPEEPAGRSTPAVVHSDDLVALVDGARTFRPSADTSWSGRPILVEQTR